MQIHASFTMHADYTVVAYSDNVTYRFPQTDMGNAGAKFFGMDQAILPVKDSVEGLVKVVSSLLSILSLTPYRRAPGQTSCRFGLKTSSLSFVISRQFVIE
jgi:hypothetical protein